MKTNSVAAWIERNPIKFIAGIVIGCSLFLMLSAGAWWGGAQNKLKSFESELSQIKGREEIRFAPPSR